MSAPAERWVRSILTVGVTNADAIPAATTDAAKLLGLEDDAGSLKPGKLADVIAVQGDPDTNLSDPDSRRADVRFRRRACR